MQAVTAVGLTIAATAIAGIVYPHLIYPLLLWLVRRVVHRPLHTQPISPTVTVVMAAYNEAEGIEACLRSIAASDYPSGRWSIVVGDDGSTDETASIVERLAAEAAIPITLRRFPRSGKNAVISALISNVDTEVLVCTDADTRWYAGSLAALVAPFADAAVGGTVGRHLPAHSATATADDAGSKEDSGYRRFEERQNRMESEIASTVASNGAMYAVRRSVVRPLPNDRVADDWMQLLNAIAAGYRVVAAANADVTEVRPATMRSETRRTARTAASGMATVAAHWRLLMPSTGWTAWFLWSHRVVRWLSPLFLVALMVGTAMSVHATAWFGLLFYGQFAVYALALLGHAAARYGQSVPVASTCTYFVAMNAAFGLAMLRAVRRTRLDAWQPDGRGA